MIKKFQQGNLILLLAAEVVLGIAQELQADPQLIVLAAQQNPEALEAAILVYTLTKDIKLTAQTFVQTLQLKTQLQTQAARHGAKLNYIKSLKHQCAEDEEVYYYKKGGSVGCGCRKKENGGEILKARPGAQLGAVARFKLSRKPNPYASEAEKKFLALRDKDRLALANKDLQKEKEYLARNKKAFEEAEKLYNSGYADHTAGEERFRKPKKEKCGSKLKKHFNGGSLNRIPFIKEVPQKKV